MKIQNKLSPMMQHYVATKEKYKDCILFYRLGDFYEMFFEDAVKTSELLELTLTGKDCGMEERAPMCGIPFHAADMYISKLVSMGEKVAICEQLTEPNGKNLVERDVIKVVTAGTVTNNELIDEKINNFLGAIYEDKDCMAFSWVDITTGEFFTKSFCGEYKTSEAVDLLVKVNPVEIIGNDMAVNTFREIPLIIHGILPKPNYFSESEFSFEIAESNLKTQLKVFSLNSFGFKENDCCIKSSGALITYLKETQKHGLVNINSIKVENGEKRMMLDVSAIRNLELVKTLKDGKSYGSLLWLLDKTKTSMGARKLSSWILSPLNDIKEINYRLDAVDSLCKNTLIRETVRETLSSIKDIGRIAGKISNGNLNPKDCIALKNSLAVLPSVKFQLSGISSAFISNIVNSCYDFSDTVTLLNNAIDEDCSSVMKDGGYIKKGFNQELDQLKSLNVNGKNLIAEMEARERTKTGIKNLRISYNRVFGYYIEVTNSFKELVPYEYERRQTLAGAERYVTEELKELEQKILTSEERALRLEAELFAKIRDFLASEIAELQKTADAIADLDVIISLSTVAKENDYIRPIIAKSSENLKIIEGRHPVVEKISKQRFVPNDCILDSFENRTMIITGPNMAGKSTYMRQVALITLMAHIGCFVPAKEAVIPITDKIFTRIGASDNLILDQSTFMVEMNEVANILNNATENSLLILDEIGRGTSTFDGLSIAWAVVEEVTEKIKSKTMFATHYHELTELEGKIEGVKNYKVTVKEMQGGIVFLRKIMRGGTNRSFGIEVAELAGIKKSVIDRAKQILKSLDKNDILKGSEFNEENRQEIKLSEIERIIKDLDVNNLSPVQAFNVLLDLNEKVKGNE